MTIEYRVVDDPEELKAIVELQTVVWSMPASEAVPHNMLFAVIHGGGNVIRADLDGELLLAVATATWAIDNGNILLYVVTIVLVVGGLRNFIKLVIALLHGNQQTN